MLQLKGATVTIDAAGCQTDIARRIVDAGGHYVLNVKGNQGTLRDGIEKFFAEYLDGQMPTVPVRQKHSTSMGHGRRESRWHYVCGVPRDLPDRDRWPGLSEPVRDWLRGLAREDRKAVGEDIKTAQFGWPMGMPLIRKLAGGLWEVRSRISSGITRVIFTVDGQTMVLLHGFQKKSQRTPPADLMTAKRRLAQLRSE